MVKINYIIREENIGRTISEDAMLDAVDIEETLKSKYDYIYNSIKENDYELEINHCTYFKEIVFKKKVVGFAAYTIINSVSTLSLVSSYILPEYREKGLFFDEINKIFEDQKQISIYKPPKFIIELLVKYGFAKKIENNLIISSIQIDIPSNTIKKIYGSDKLFYEDYTYTANIYDINQCGFIVIPDENNKIIYMTNPSEADYKDNKISDANLDDEYFENIIKTLKRNQETIHDFLEKIEKNYHINIETTIDTTETIDFEELKKIKKEELIEENILENFDKIENDKNSLLNNDSIDKEKYIKAYKNVGIYDFIKTFEENQNIELTNSIIKIDFEFKNDYIKQNVLKEELISNRVDNEVEEEYLKSLNVNQLKDILKNNNLTVSGNKSNLIERIMEYVPSNSIIEEEYHITEKGYEFINEHDEIEYYNLCLKNFHYYEFKKFTEEHDTPLNEAVEKFLNEHLKNSVKNRNYKEYSDSINALAFINEINDNNEKGLYYELKKFIFGLNPVFLDETQYNYYQPISKNNIEDIKILLFKNKVDLNEKFKEVWNEMEIKEFPIPYEKSFNILNKMISGDDRDYMNDKIREQYLSKETIIHDKLDKSVQSTLDNYLNY